MNVIEYSELIIQELNQTLVKVDIEKGEAFKEKIIESNNIFVAGVGRSGLACKAFAMRLMHLGFNSYVVGETTTPNIAKGDLLVIGSGSGETESLVTMVKKAKKLGSYIVLLSTRSESTIGKNADIVIKIPAITPKTDNDEMVTSIQPMGSLFEQSLLLFYDATILRIMESIGKDSEMMFKNHSNLE